MERTNLGKAPGLRYDLSESEGPVGGGRVGLRPKVARPKITKP